MTPALFRATSAAAFALACAAAGQAANAQAPCSGKSLTGLVQDTTGGIIPGASVTIDSQPARTSGADGRVRIPCVGAGAHHLTASAAGFATTQLNLRATAGELRITLVPSANVEINVTANSPQDSIAAGGIAGTTLAGDQIQSLADDPDDLQRELQQLAASAGGSPGSTTISVDGFQGDAKLPPKSSIAYIKVNPDLFSAEYRNPPFEGGRIEIYTKPGATNFHGALFTTNSSSWMNARDPFSIAPAAIGKQRYGFELTGPVRKQGSNFSVNLEHRAIDNFAVVNAITLDANGNQTTTVANVPVPQQLWVGSARVDWQLGPKNIAFASFSTNVNHLANVGVGGTSLAETGYDSGQYQHTLRLSNVTTASAKLVHEARVAIDWVGEDDVPTSSAPQVQVAGAFTGGGASIGQQRMRELRTEWDDDAILTVKHHLIKVGWQFFTFDDHQRLSTNFNGTYIFGGVASAPLLDSNNQPTGQTGAITGFEQYRRTLLNLPGGAPTQFSNVAGNPEVDFHQVRLNLFAQDDWKVRPNLTLSFGLRYFLENDPLNLNAATPRFGVSWVPDAKKTWDLNFHAGIFASQFKTPDWAEILREDGVQRVTSLVYNPAYAPGGAPATTGPNTIHAERTLSPGLNDPTNGIVAVGASKTFPHGWSLSANFIDVRIWGLPRSLNINTPLNGQPTGPRPLTPNLNIYQLGNNGSGLGDIEFVGLSNQSLKRVQFFFGAVRINIRTDDDNNPFSSPQSSTSDAGEFARRSNNSLWQNFGNATFKLPYKVVLSSNYYGNGNTPYNITTGFDNNGDGNFNDRPQFATAAQLAAPGQPGVYHTQYGALVASGGTGTLNRNGGSLPWSFHLDGNIQRAFNITRNPKADHQQTLTANIRSSNLLNHTNVTAESGVLGSPFFGVPYAADNGRRIEGGLRYSF